MDLISILRYETPRPRKSWTLGLFSDRITDTRPPKIQGIQIVPIEGKGVVNGKSKKLEIKPVTAKNGKQTITGKIEVWGEIGLAVKAYDYMDNTTNIYGVREITRHGRQPSDFP
mgnify:FL=1